MAFILFFGTLLVLPQVSIGAGCYAFVASCDGDEPAPERCGGCGAGSEGEELQFTADAVPVTVPLQTRNKLIPAPLVGSTLLDCSAGDAVYRSYTNADCSGSSVDVALGDDSGCTPFGGGLSIAYDCDGDANDGEEDDDDIDNEDDEADDDGDDDDGGSDDMREALESAPVGCISIHDTDDCCDIAAANCDCLSELLPARVACNVRAFSLFAPAYVYHTRCCP